MHPATIRSLWFETFPHALPAGYLCRQHAADRWLRIHSLPAAKRYPDNESEQAVVLHRYNTAATVLLGEAAECILFVARFGAQACWRDDDVGWFDGLNLVPVLTHSNGDEVMRFFAVPVHWQAQHFDALLAAVAHDEIRLVLFFNPARRTAFAPYDGGADLFVAAPEALAPLRQRFAAWLSERSDGL